MQNYIVSETRKEDGTAVRSEYKINILHADTDQRGKISGLRELRF